MRGAAVVAVIGAPERDLGAVYALLDKLRSAVPADVEIPLLGSARWCHADPAMQLASLARYAELAIAELDPAIVAARLAAELALARRERTAAMVDASHAVSAAGAPWTGFDRVDHAELLRRRGEVGRPARDGGAR